MRTRRCWLEIDLEALDHNLAIVRHFIGPEVGIIAVVKANAYGHGVAAVVRRLSGKVAMFAVACLDEAREIRSLDPTTPVLLLGPSLPDERAEVVGEGFIPVISNLDEARAYASLGSQSHPTIVHLALDTGMGRIGVREEESAAFCREVIKFETLQVAAITSHLPCADEDEVYTTEQIRRFEALVDHLRSHFFQKKPPSRHLLNSAGILLKRGGVGDFVRAGLMLYGAAPLPNFATMLRPVMTWKSRITLVRDLGPGCGISYGRTYVTPGPMRVATISAGYADGYLRSLSNRGAEVLVAGQRCAVLGRVTMDQIVVDVSRFSTEQAPQEGAEVVLMGNMGKETISAFELAEKAGTIPWELMTSAGNGACRARVLY